MTIGSLGGVYFSVSSDTVQTLNDLSMSKSISYGTHKVHGGKTLLEYVGRDPDGIQFSVHLSAYLGVDPSATIRQFDEIADAGQAVGFVLGTKVYGSGWVITDISKSYDQIYKDGALIAATLRLTLKEYGG